MTAGLTDHVWSLADILAVQAPIRMIPLNTRPDLPRPVYSCQRLFLLLFLYPIKFPAKLLLKFSGLLSDYLLSLVPLKRRISTLSIKTDKDKSLSILLALWRLKKCHKNLS